MPTPKGGYRLKDGSRVPGTTTVIGRFKESGGLIQWAYKRGKEDGLAGNARARLYDEVGKAADIGTMAHWLVEKHIDRASFLGKSVGTLREAFPDMSPDMYKTAHDAFQAYLDWQDMTHLEIVEQEMELVSEEYKYGGTPDAIGVVNGKLCLVDWKTSNGVYSDHLVQLAAYRHLWNETHPERQLTGGSHLCRFAKTHGDFAHHHYPNLDDGWEQFKLFRRAYEVDKSLKERTK
jgi:hypothetical protein